MEFRDAIKISLNNLRANKVRSFLTMLGLVIGITAIIIIMSVGAGAQSLIINQIKNFGTDLIGVLPGSSDESGPPASVFGIIITTLKYEDALALEKRQNVEHALAAAAYITGQGTISWRDVSAQSTYTGTTANYTTVEEAEVARGRFFDESEERSISRMVVLGPTMAEDLFGDQDPIGETIKIEKSAFKVIGVMKERGVVGLENQDNKIFIPLATAQKLLLGVNHVTLIRVKIDDTAYVDQSIEEIKQTLREQHNIDDPTDDDFSVRSSAQALDIVTTITDALKFFLAAVGGLALVVGGIGIMNIMLIAVNERIREIGLRKAVGARNIHLITQFLVETVVITLVAGAIGIIIGTAFSGAVAAVANYLNYDWDFVVSLQSIALGLGVSSLIGLVFGLYPALKTSKIDPIEALRYE
ncbi:MAG: ABC transporter permease [Patescibacteria group bacterium]